MAEETQNATPEPTSTPEPAAPQTESPSQEGASPSDVFSGFDFSTMDFAEETGDTTVVDNTQPEKGQQQAPVQPAAPAAPSATAAPAPTVPIAQQTAPAPSSTPAPQTQAPPGTGEAETDPYIEGWRQNQVQLDAALRQYYALDDATAEKLLENPKEILPAIMARAHMAILQNTYKAVLDRIPPLMNQTAENVQRNAQNEDQFYKAWPIFNRDDPVQVETLLSYGQMFRQMHPQASAADFTKFVGAAAAAHLGLKMPRTGANGKDNRKPLPYNPAGASAPASGSGNPVPTQFEDFFNAVKMD